MSKSPRKPKPEVKKRLSPSAKMHPSQQLSPCAARCRHQWCLGYHQGYADGNEDIGRNP